MSDNHTLADQIIVPQKGLEQKTASVNKKQTSSKFLSVVLQRTTLTALFLAMIVVVFGAYVRLTDAGLGCPDWPGCYGQLDVPETSEEIAQAELKFNKKVEPQKAWNEMIHRFLASGLGFLIIIITFIAFKIKQHYLLALGLLIMVCFQGALGMWTVTLLLKLINEVLMV